MNIPKSVWWLVIGMALNIWFKFFVAFKYNLYEKKNLEKCLTVAEV